MAAFLAKLVNLPPAWHWTAYVFVALIQVAVLLALVMVSVAFFTWLERKVSARIQDRLGPMRVGGRFGWLQVAADGIKLLGKEDLVPTAADGMLYRLAPYVCFCASFAIYMAVPFADGWVVQPMNTAVFFILAVAGLEVFGVILAGYASGSKWSLFGAMREAAQVVSYEVPLALCAAIPVMIAGTMNLTEIGRQQSGLLHNWFLFHDPFTFVTFFIYLTCATASVNRAPFDLAEAESELVAGFMTEYSGFRWSVFFMAEYGSMMAVSGLGAILFCGGWNGPLPIGEWLHLTHQTHPVLGFLGDCLGACNFVLKAHLGVVFMMWVRWTHPRLRIDQVMTVCLKYCIPLASLMFLGAMSWLYFLPGGLTAKLLRPQPAKAAVVAAAPIASLPTSSTPREGGR